MKDVNTTRCIFKDLSEDLLDILEDEDDFLQTFVKMILSPRKRRLLNFQRRWKLKTGYPAWIDTKKYSKMAQRLAAKYYR